MIDICQWRASIGLWNYCQAASSRPANGRHSHSFKAAVDSKSGSTTSGEKTSKLPAALSLIAFLLFLSLLRHIFIIPPTGNCYQVQCTTGVTVTDTNYLQSVVLPGGSSSNLIYNDLYLIVCLRMLLLLSGDVELNPGPITGNPKDTLRTHSDKLVHAISVNLYNVTDALYAKGLIPQQTKEEVHVSGVTNNEKSSKLVNLIEQQLEFCLNPEQYLIDICHVLINQEYRALTDIATSILHQLGSKNLDIEDLRKSGTLEQWCKEGIMELTLTRVLMIGPAGSGKTCAQRLLLNKDPPPLKPASSSGPSTTSDQHTITPPATSSPPANPLISSDSTTEVQSSGLTLVSKPTTDSTPIACKAVKALRIAGGDGKMTWKEITPDELREKLAASLKEAAENAAQQKQSESVKVVPLLNKSDDKQKETPADRKAPRPGDEFKKLSELMHKAKALPLNKKSQKWVYIVDSGGQPAYQELLPLFTRAASLNVITLDISRKFDDKFEFMYRINGQEFPCDGGIKYTNRKIFNSVVSSASVQKPIDIPFVKRQPKHSMSFVLGTHYDVLIERTNEKDAETKVVEMSSNLMSELPHLESRIISQVHGNSVIYPVNAMEKNSGKRQKNSREILEIMSKCTEATMEIEVPMRCFVFELYLEKKANGKGFVTKEEVIQGCKEDLYMNEDDIEIALTFLHTSTIILYYPDIDPQLVLIDPQIIINVLSHLLALTYVSYPIPATSLAPNILKAEMTCLKKRGCFKKVLLEKFCGVFSKDFKSDYFINLLQHLHIITEFKSQFYDSSYFLPVALPAYNNNYDKDLPETIRPLYYVWLELAEDEWEPKNSVHVPQGLFPLIYVRLLQQKEYEVKFAPNLKYHDAVSLWVYIEGKRYTLYIINRYEHIEVYFDGPQKYCPKKYCPQIRELITTTINKSSDVINAKRNYTIAFPCPNGKEHCYCIVDEENKVADCQCDTNYNIGENDETHWCWFGFESYSITAGIKEDDLLNTTHLHDVRMLLKEGQFSNAKWINFGLGLGLYNDTLNKIKADYPNLRPQDATKCVRECLVKWLEKADGVNDKGGAKWSTLIKALEDYNQNATADYIKKAKSTGREDTNSKKQIGKTATSQDKTKSDDQKSDTPPDVSDEHCPKLEHISITMKSFGKLIGEEKKFIKEEVSVILVTATPIEYRAVMGSTEPTGEDGNFIKVVTQDKKANFILGKFGPCNVAIISTGQGPYKTEDILVSVQKDVEAKYVIAIGICYGAKESKTEELSDKTKLADIIVAESIVDTTEKRYEEAKTIVMTKEYKCGGKLLNLFKHDDVFKFESKPAVKVHVGVLASESTLFRNEEEKEKILEYVPRALGGEMEANGIHRVAEREQQFQWIVIKTIVDWGNEKKDKKWQKFAAVSCAKFVRQCLEDNEQPDGGDPLKEF